MSSSRRHRAGRVVAATGVLGVLGVLVVAPALADSDNGSRVSSIDAETVQVYTEPDGTPTTKRVYEQFSMTGHGLVRVDNPVATKGLRNLDGFSGASSQHGIQRVSTSVDGQKRLRSVATYDKSLPLTVKVRYLLDGKRVSAKDVVGRSGRLDVTYAVKNVTGRRQAVEVPDGAGGTVRRMLDVPVPMVGTLTSTLPSDFTAVTSRQAQLAADGRGGTKVSFLLTLVPPVGSSTAVVGYTAHIHDGVVPTAELDALPVDPVRSPIFATAKSGYAEGAATGAELVSGAGAIDTNLLKLRDGAADLVDGLIQLHDGAGQLDGGLTGQAAPGAEKLSAGADKLTAGLDALTAGARKVATGNRTLRDGTVKLRDGAAKLHGGGTQLATGAGTALAGSQSLTAGLQQISGGLGTLADAQTGLPGAVAGITTLKGAVDQLLLGLGDPATPTSLIGGLASLSTGLAAAHDGSTQLGGGLTPLRTGVVTAKGGVDQVAAGLGAAVGTGGSLAQLSGGLTGLKTNPGCQADAVCLGTVNQLLSGVGASTADLGSARQGLLDVSAGLGQAIGGLDTQLIPGSQALTGGIGQAQSGVTALQSGAGQVKGGLTQVRAGLDSLSVGVQKAVAGVLQLSPGADSAYAGSSKLTTGLGSLKTGADQVAEGAGQLDAGSSTAAAGAEKLAGGADQVAAGAGKANTGSGALATGARTLSEGVVSAAAGSAKLNQGLGSATGQAPALVSGAGRLSTEGTSEVVEQAKGTALEYGQKVAVLNAGSRRARTAMAIGAPQGSTGLSAYSYVIDGVDGQGARNTIRGVGGLAVLGAGGGVFWLRRRSLGV